MNAPTLDRECSPERRSARRLRGFVLVTGGKGGVGKTTLAANLGVALARAARAEEGIETRPARAIEPCAAEGGEGPEPSRDPATPHLHPSDSASPPAVTPAARIPQGGGRPLLVDLDLGLANLDVLLRLSPERGIETFLGGERPLEECLVEGPAGLHVLPACSGEADLARPDEARRRRLLRGLARLAERFGVVVGDSPAGIGPDVMHFAAHAQRVLVVTTPEPAAMTDAYGLIKALDGFSREAGVDVPTPEIFVNLAADSVEARNVGERLGGVCRRFLARSPRLVGWMPRSRVVLRSVITQTPFALSDPRSLPARCVDRLARRFSGRVRDLGPRNAC